MKKHKNVMDIPREGDENTREQKLRRHADQQIDDDSVERINDRHRNEIAGADADYNPDLARDPSPFSDEELGPDHDMGKNIK